MKKIFISILDMKENMSGVELSASARSNILCDSLGREVCYLTSLYNNFIHKNLEINKSLGKISSKANVISIYDYYQEIDLKTNAVPLRIKDISFKRFLKMENGIGYRIYDEDGVFSAYCETDESDVVEFVNILKDNKPIRREHYDSRGFLSRFDEIIYTDSSTVIVENYLRLDGSAAIVKHILIKDKKLECLGIHLLSSTGKHVRFFKTEEEWIKAWYVDIVTKNPTAIYIVDRTMEFYEPLVLANEMNGSKAKIVPVVHNVHTGGDVFEGVVSYFYKSVLENLSKSSAIIVPTELQKNDIEARFGNSSFVVIPHSYKKPQKISPCKNRDLKKIVYLARYDKQKRHDHALKAFKIVLDRIPDARLFLYGFGVEKDHILKLVNDLEITDSVFVNDFLHDISLGYKDAGLSILTSSVEGFCMSVMESLFYGCPVISYDVKYGPSSMIENGRNGFLVLPGDVQGLADKIIQVLSEIETHKKLIENCQSSVDHLSHENVAKLWSDLLIDLETNDYRNAAN